LHCQTSAFLGMPQRGISIIGENRQTGQYNLIEVILKIGTAFSLKM